MKDLPEQQVAQASAMNNMARRLVSSLGVVALSVYYDMSVRASLELGIAYSDASASALHVAFFCLGGYRAGMSPSGVDAGAHRCLVEHGDTFLLKRPAANVASRKSQMIPFQTHRITWRPSLGKTLLSVAFVVSLMGATCAAQPLRSQTHSVERVVTLYQGATDSAVALGITPIGVVDSWLEKPMYRYLRDELNDVPHVGLETQPNLEKNRLAEP